MWSAVLPRPMRRSTQFEYRIVMRVADLEDGGDGGRSPSASPRTPECGGAARS